MGLNIKNPETVRLARELAALTGNSMTGAITVALSEQLRRVEREQNREWRLKRMREISEDMARRLKGSGLTSRNFRDMLYGEDGLPK